MRERFISQGSEDQEIFINLSRSATIALNLMALIERILSSGQSGAGTAKHITGNAACSTVRSGATIMVMDLRAIEGSAVTPGCFNLAGAAQ
jgi:hypothetical protein